MQFLLLQTPGLIQATVSSGGQWSREGCGGRTYSLTLGLAVGAWGPRASCSLEGHPGDRPEGPPVGAGPAHEDVRAQPEVLASWAASSRTLSALYLHQSPALL